ncbi:MAG: DUF4105 domain-containing protein [Alphaproteobacteria bacterium]|nr:DUF4105 domain-containing protein [Alphaproteobacteria bacterium]
MRLFFIFFLFFYSSILKADEVQKALDLNLDQHPAWTRLLHFHKNESTIDNPQFFLSDQGKFDKKAELIATIKAFLKKEKICVFPARYEFLSENLGWKKEKLNCPELDKIKKDVNPQKISLIYASSYLGNPASFFGHTLIRIDNQPNMPLISQAVNYGAIVGNAGIFDYVVQGIGGGFNGVFTLNSYYDTINEYSFMENRDLWEYQLKLTDEQLKMFIYHLSEVLPFSAKYYFFTENCSYMILELLNIVQPETDWTEELPSLYTLPSDTVRIIVQNHHLLDEAVYRPSRQTKVLSAYKGIPVQQRPFVKRIAEHPEQEFEKIKDYSKKEQAVLLETAYELIQYNSIIEKISVKERQEKSEKILAYYNLLNEKNAMASPIPPKIRPDEGHKASSFRVEFSHKGHKNYTLINYRPVFHSLLDDSRGYVPYTQVNYLDSTFAIDEKGKVRLDELSAVNLQSYTPWTDIIKPVSFRANIGQKRIYDSHKDKDISLFDLSGGIGASGYFFDALNSYILGLVSVNLGQKNMVGVGAEAGVIVDFEWLRSKIFVQKIGYTNPDFNQTQFGAEIQTTIAPNVDLVFGGKHIDGRVKNRDEIKAGILFHF